MGIAVFGGIFILVCLWMAIKPSHFCQQLIRFSNWPHFHRFEIVLRLIMALCFWYFAQASRQPIIMLIIAVALLVVAIGLVVIGEEKHRAFTVFIENKLHSYFQVIGVISWPVGLWLILSVL